MIWALPPGLRRHVEPQTTGCWLWTGCRSRQGYGRTGPTHHYAHRAVWVAMKGMIPPGHVLHHRCYTRACVNPRHLEAQERGPHVAGHHPRLTIDERRTRQRQRQAQWLLKRAAERGCRHCAAPAQPDRTYCLKHLLLARQSKQRSRARARRAR